MIPGQKKKQAMETLELIDKNFKAAIIHMFKDLKKSAIKNVQRNFSW